MLNTVKELFQHFAVDPSFVDLVVWFPYLSWHDFIVSLVTVLTWRFASDRMQRFASFYLRRVCAHGLLRIALLVRPKGPYRAPQTWRPIKRKPEPRRVSVQRGYAGPAGAAFAR